MNKLENVIQGLQLCMDCQCDDCKAEKASHYPWDCEAFSIFVCDALSLLKAQNEVITELRKIGYPHDFQNEKPWIVDYMNLITEVIKKAVNLRNEVSTIPEEKV